MKLLPSMHTVGHRSAGSQQPAPVRFSSTSARPEELRRRLAPLVGQDRLVTKRGRLSRRQWLPLAPAARFGKEPRVAGGWPSRRRAAAVSPKKSSARQLRSSAIRSAASQTISTRCSGPRSIASTRWQESYKTLGLLDRIIVTDSSQFSSGLEQPSTCCCRRPMMPDRDVPQAGLRS